MGVRDLEAVLITGVFGSGKSSVAVEIADVEDLTIANDRPIRQLAARPVRLGAIDMRGTTGGP